MTNQQVLKHKLWESTHNLPRGFLFVDINYVFHQKVALQAINSMPVQHHFMPTGWTPESASWGHWSRSTRLPQGVGGLARRRWESWGFCWGSVLLTYPFVRNVALLGSSNRNPGGHFELQWHSSVPGQVMQIGPLPATMTRVGNCRVTNCYRQTLAKDYSQPSHVQLARITHYMHSTVTQSPTHIWVLGYIQTAEWWSSD